MNIKWDLKVKEFASVDLIHVSQVKHPMHFQLNWAILLCYLIPEGKTE
jgi:hypothetical protein